MSSERHACPCCGHWVAGREGQYVICPRCAWEDDPVQTRDTAFAGGANVLSLDEARRRWRASHPRCLVKRRRYGLGRS